VVVVVVVALLNIFVEEIISLVVLLFIMLIPRVDNNWRFRSSHSSCWLKTDNIPDERRRRMEMTTIMMSWYFISGERRRVLINPGREACIQFFEAPRRSLSLHKKGFRFFSQWQLIVFDSFLFSSPKEKKIPSISPARVNKRREIK
jgi:hypothetical protein